MASSRPRCPVCGDSFKDLRGLNGHLRMSHGVTGDEHEEKMQEARRSMEEGGQVQLDVEDLSGLSEELIAQGGLMDLLDDADPRLRRLLMLIDRKRKLLELMDEVEDFRTHQPELFDEGSDEVFSDLWYELDEQMQEVMDDAITYVNQLAASHRDE